MSSPNAQSSTQESNPANAAVLNGSGGTLTGARHPGAPSAAMNAILDNLMANVPDPSQLIVAPASVHAPSQVVPPPAAPAAPPVEAKTEIKPADGFTPHVEELPAEPPVSTQAVVEEDDLGDLNEELVKKPGFKNLRENYKTLKQQHKETQERLAAAEAEREEYRTGKKLPETVQDQEAEIQRLRGFEKVLNVKSHPEYVEKEKPLGEIDAQLQNIFASYEIPAEEIKGELNELRSLGSEKAVNQFLEERFTPIAALEVKQLLNKEKAINQELRTLESDAEKGLQTLTEQAKQMAVVRKNQERQKVQGWVRDAWSEVNTELKTDGRFHGLVPQEGRSEWNQTVVQPTLKKAAEESGKLLKSIIEEGLTPQNVKAIQKMTMLALHAGITAEHLNASLTHIRNSEQSAIKDTNIFRPPVGMGSPSVTPSKPRERMSADSFADKSLGTIPGIGK